MGTADERIRLVNYAEAEHRQEIEDIFSACGAAMIIRKSLFEEIGGFDSKFFAYFEDVDLCWRIRLGGYRIVLLSSSIVYHVRGATSKKFGKRVFDFHLYKNQVAMLIKNYSARNLLMVIPAVAMLYMFRVVNGLVQNDAYLAVAPLKAFYWNVKELRYLAQKRVFVQQNIRHVGDDAIARMMVKMPIQLVSHSRKK